DITRLLEELDNIAGTTTFNGKSLLAGGFSDAKFQIGAYSNQIIKASIRATSSDKVGQTRFETGQTITDPQEITLTFQAVNGIDDITLESVVISHTVGTGIGALSEVINKNSNELQVRASWSVQSTGEKTIGHTIATDTTKNRVDGLTINGTKLGTINDILPNDADGKVLAAINNLTSQTGVQASVDARGHLVLASQDGRGIVVEATTGLDVLGLELNTDNNTKHKNYGRLTLIRNDARDIIVVANDATGNPTNDAHSIGFGKTAGTEAAETVINLRSIRGPFNLGQAS
ncbi:flagellin B, partial [Methylococcaceae bacterium CS4]